MLLAMVDFFIPPRSRKGGILTLNILCIAIHEKKNIFARTFLFFILVKFNFEIRICHKNLH